MLFWKELARVGNRGQEIENQDILNRRGRGGRKGRELLPQGDLIGGPTGTGRVAHPFQYCVLLCVSLRRLRVPILCGERDFGFCARSKGWVSMSVALTSSIPDPDLAWLTRIVITEAAPSPQLRRSYPASL